MMHLQWHGANGQILDIREPDNAVPDPPYVYLTSSGFGGGGCDVQTVKGPYQHGATFLGALLVPRTISLTFAILAQSTEDLYQRRRTVAAARHRHQAGASPESVVLTAEAALARAELAVERAARQEQAARQHLAALWGERDPRFRLAAADPLALPALAELDELAAWLERTPELIRFADEQRVGDARLQLARCATAADLDWQVGVRRLQESGDTALVGSLLLPLGPAHRAGPEIRAAEAGLAALAIERESRDVALYSTLVQAHGRYRVGQQDVQRTAQDILPRLARAERAAERAYQAGAISYLEWAQLQSERIAVQREQLAAALEAHAALIEIQRLTGQPLVTGAVASGLGTAP